MANYIIENNNSLNFSLEILFTNSNLRSIEQGNLLWDNTKVHIELFEQKHSGNVTGKNSRTIFGDSMILSKIENSWEEQS